MRREKNYFEWNPEARAIVACSLVVFVAPCIIEVWFPRAASLFFCPSLALLSVWQLSYLWRAGEYRRRMIAFRKTWGGR